MKSPLSNTALSVMFSIQRGKVTYVASHARLMLSSLVILFGISALPSFFATSSFGDICHQIDNRLPCSVPTVTSPYYEGYDLGIVVGDQVAEAAKAFFASDDGCPVFEELYDVSETFRRFIDDYMTAHEVAFPMEHAELLGMAESMDIEASTVFMQNGCSELHLLFGDNVQVSTNPSIVNPPPIYAPYLTPTSLSSSLVNPHEHCSDIGLIYDSPSGAHVVQGHNEDWWSTVADKMSMIRTPQWWGYIYPGNFAGTSLVVNSHGLSFTMNSVYPTAPGYHCDSAPNHAGISYLFSYTLRAILNATSTSQATQMLSRFPIYGGYSLNIMSGCENTITNIEGYGNRLNVETRTTAQPGSIPHFNIYVNTNLPQDDVGTSQERMECAKRSTFNGPSDVRSFLGNLTCPIFFTESNGMHMSETLSSWIIDPVARVASMYRLPVDCSPSLSRCAAFPDPVVYDWEFKCVN